MNVFLLGVQLLLAATLLWASFCRLVHSTDDTAREIRWAFLFEFIAAGFVLGAPVLPLLMPDLSLWKPWTTPRWVWVALLGSMCVSNLATARYWLTGRAQERFRRTARTELDQFWRVGLGFVAVVLLVGGTAAGPRMAVAKALPKGEPPILPIAHMQPGQRALCAAPEGCVIFAAHALAIELARFADQACPMPKGSRT